MSLSSKMAESTPLLATLMKYAAPVNMCACCNDYAKEEALVWKETERPKPTGSEVLIQVKTVAINPVDWKRSQGAGTCFPPKPLSDLCGVVVAKGPSATGPLKVGDEVLTCLYPSGGALAEYVLAEESKVGLKPAGWEDTQASAIPMGAITAGWALKFCNLGPGKKIVIIGASGGVGQMMLILARPTGASILAVASKSKHEMCKALGGPNVKCCDYKTEKWTSMCDDRPDVVVDVSSVSPIWSFHEAVSVRAKRFVTSNPSDPSFCTVNGPLIAVECLWCCYAQGCATLGCCGLCGPSYCCTPWPGTAGLTDALGTIAQQADKGELPPNPFQVQIFAPDQVHMAYDLAQTKPGSKPVIDMKKLK